MKRNLKKNGTLVFLIIILALFAGSCQTDHSEKFTVMEGRFTASFIETGELAAIRSTAITMPRINYQYGYEFKIIGMVDNGSEVKEGDTLVRLDDSSIQKYIISSQEALETERAAEKKQAVECRNSIQDLEAQLKTEQASYDLKKLQLARAEYDTPQKQKIKELEFQQATIRIEKIKRQLRMKPILNEYDQKVQRIKIKQKEADLQGAFHALKEMALTSPEDGLFQVGYNMFQYPPKDLKVGDAVYQGALVARIPDVSRMRVTSYINEADLTKVKVGGKVIIRLDALPTQAFHGKVTYINRTCTTQDKKKVFKVQVEVEESDLRLKPGMTVGCEYICYEKDKEIFAPNNCVLQENGKAYVFLDKGNNPERIEVKAGFSNSHHTQISGNIRPGQRLMPFEDFLNQKSS